MLTGMVLFRPPAEEGVSISEGQLKMMVNLLGKIPKDMIKQGNQASLYFDHHGIMLRKQNSYVVGSFRSGPNVEPKGSSVRRILEIWKEKSKRYIDLSPEEVLVVEDLLRRMWEISPRRRETANKLLGHKWFRGLES
jgi:hypothetical protein